VSPLSIYPSHACISCPRSQFRRDQPATETNRKVDGSSRLRDDE
jgi:hypothetical protein